MFGTICVASVFNTMVVGYLGFGVGEPSVIAGLILALGGVWLVRVGFIRSRPLESVKEG